MEPTKKPSRAPIFIIGCVVVLFGGIFVVGILAAIAIPAFVNYARRAKTAEAQANVRSIAIGVESYCASTSALPSAIAPDFVPNATRQIGANDPAWQSVGFSSGDPLYYAYAIERPDAAHAVVVATGDLDADGVQSRFESTCTIETSSCTCSAISVTNELE